MADVKKTTGVPDEQGKGIKKAGEIKITLPIPDEETDAIQPPESFILETEITRKPSPDGTPGAGTPETPKTPTHAPAKKPTPQRPASPAPATPTPQPGSPKASAPPAPPGPSPGTPPGPSPQTPSPGTMDTGPRPQTPPQPQKPPGKGTAPVRPLGDQLQERSPDAQGDQGPTEGTQPSPDDQPTQGFQKDTTKKDKIQTTEDIYAEYHYNEALKAQKARDAAQIQSDERAAGRAHLIELIAQAIVTGLEFIDSLLKFLGNIAKPIPIIGWIVQIIVWIARAIVTVLEFLPKGVAKGERKDEDRLRLRASKLRKEASRLGTWGGKNLPPAPDNPHGAAETTAEGLTSDNVRLPVLSLLRPSTEPFNLLPGLFKINPPLSGILKIFIIAGGIALMLLSLGGMITLIQSSQT